MTIKVRATARGFYGQLREVDEEFTIKEEKDFSDTWMEKVEAEKPAKAEKPDK